MAKKIKNDKIEIGDFVEIVKGSSLNPWNNIGWVGVLDNEFVKDGVVLFAVIDDCDPDIFYYAEEIKLYKKA